MESLYYNLNIEQIEENIKKINSEESELYIDIFFFGLFYG